MIVLAPTGIAAINAGGVTIHSFFQVPFAPYVPESHSARMAKHLTVSVTGKRKSTLYAV